MNDDAMDAAKYNTASGKKFSLSEDDYRDILPEFVKLHQRLRSSRPTFMDRVISDLERGDDEVDWSNFTIKSMYGKELQ